MHPPPPPHTHTHTHTPEQEGAQEDKEEDTDAPTTLSKRDTVVIPETQMSRVLPKHPQSLEVAVRPLTRRTARG